jgi:hypothetical protein
MVDRGVQFQQMRRQIADAEVFVARSHAVFGDVNRQAIAPVKLSQQFAKSVHSLTMWPSTCVGDVAVPQRKFSGNFKSPDIFADNVGQN